MSLDRLYRVGVTWLLAEPESFANAATPTTTEITTGLSNGMIFNATCALWEDSTELTLGDPDVDTGLTFCNIGTEQYPTFDNVTVKLTLLRDKDRTATTGTWNGTFDRLSHEDQEFVLIHRTGNKTSAQAFAIGDIIQTVDFKTDFPIDVIASGANVQLTQNGLVQSLLNWNYSIAS